MNHIVLTHPQWIIKVVVKDIGISQNTNKAQQDQLKRTLAIGEWSCFSKYIKLYWHICIYQHIYCKMYQIILQLQRRKLPFSLRVHSRMLKLLIDRNAYRKITRKQIHFETTYLNWNTKMCIFIECLLIVHIWHVYWMLIACKSVLKSYLWFIWMGPIKLEMRILLLYCLFSSFFKSINSLCKVKQITSLNLYHIL